LPNRRPARNAPKREHLEYWLGQFSQVDPLTALPNRHQFLDRLAGAMARAARSHQLVGVMLLNIDHFKALNAAHGHQVADLVLQKLAERLKDCARKSDTVARIGGDEFAVLLEGLADKEGAAVAAQRLMKAFGRPLTLDAVDIAVTATVGVAFHPSDGDTVDTLLQNADTAMCEAREQQRGTCRFYSPELHRHSRDDALRSARIEQGLARLTPREREVLQVLVDGNANKTIAYMLGASTRTIENHRARIMQKMGSHSLAELMRMVLDRPAASKPPSAPEKPSR